MGQRGGRSKEARECKETRGEQRRLVAALVDLKCDELLREARHLERAVTRHAGRRATREPAEAARPCSCCCTKAAEGRRAYRSQTSLGRRFFSIESDASAGCSESALPT